MPTFRLKADHGPVDVFHPAGHFESLHVEPGETVEVSGSVLSQSVEVVVIGTGEDDARGWPLGVWDLVEAPRVSGSKSTEGK